MNAILITVRTGSSRLPNKCLRELNNIITVIDNVIYRAKLSSKSEKIILCTTTLQEDDILEDIANKHNICFFRGSVKDKIDRWYRCCVEHKIDNIVTFDADDPFCEPKLMDNAFCQLEDGFDFIKPGNIACGLFSYAFNFKTLEKVFLNKKSNETEMINSFFDDIKDIKTDTIRAEEEFFNDRVRLTIDYEEDFFLFLILFYRFDFSTDSRHILNFLDNNLNVRNLNFFRQNHYLENQKNIINRQLNEKHV